MAAKKVTITLDESLLDAVASIARDASIPLSRLVAEATEREMRMRVGRAAMDDWQAEHGIFTPDEIAAARAEMAAADTEYLGNFGSTSSAA